MPLLRILTPFLLPHLFLRLIRETAYDGMAGLFVFNPKDQSAIPGEYLMPLIWHQIWDGKSLHTEPKRFKKATYRKPPWIKN